MPSSIVPVTPPRVALVDPKTGLISREWYRFFLSLFSVTGDSTVSLDDLQKGPPSLSVDDIITRISQATEDVSPSREDALSQIAELTKRVQALESQPPVSLDCEYSEVLAWLSPE